MLTFDLVHTDKHSTNDLLQPKNLRFLRCANYKYKKVGGNIDKNQMNNIKK